MIAKYMPLNVITTFILLLSFKLALAVIPPVLNYQGHLTDKSGAPVDGAVNMVFALYDIESGGTALWSVSRSVMVYQGVFSVELGEGVNPFPLDLFANPLWMGLTVSSDSEMAPRRPISSTAYSFKADDANTLEGISASTLDQSTHVDDSANPHNVTATQIGAVTALDISNHAALPDIHHLPYTNIEAVTALQAHDGTGVNADTVDGADSSAFASSVHSHSATDINTGTLSVARYSAYSDLGSEGRLDNNSSTDLLTRSQSDSLYSSASHGHSATDITTGTISTSRYSAYSDLNSEGLLDNNSSTDLLTRGQGDARYVRMSGGCLTVALSICPIGDNDGPKCDEVLPGAMCEGDGECGTSETLNNCSSKYEWYMRVQ